MNTILCPAIGSIWKLPGGHTIRVLRLLGEMVQAYWFEGNGPTAISLRYFQPMELYALTPYDPFADTAPETPCRDGTCPQSEQKTAPQATTVVNFARKLAVVC